MPKANPIQTNFSAGEVSPLLRGRVDTQKYANGAEVLENFIVTPQGPIKRRPGFKYLADAYTPTRSTRIVPFRFSNTDVYLIEFGREIIRIWKSETVLNTAAGTHAISGAGLGNPGKTRITTSAAHGHTGAVNVFVEGVLGHTNVNDYFGTATVTGATTIDLDLSPSNQVYISGGTIYVLSATAIVLVSPYFSWSFDVDLKKLYFAQSADILYICHPDYQTRKLSRTGQLNWTLATLDAIDGPYMSIDSRDIRMTLSNVVDSATLIDTSAPFIAADVNEYVEWNEHGVWKLAKVTAFVSSTQVAVDIVSNTLVDLDPNIRLSSKTGSDKTARSILNGTLYGKSVSTADPIRPNTGFRPGSPSGLGPQYRTSGVVREGVDPSAVLAVPANVTSTHAGTFSRNDIGKFLRRTTRGWRKITGLVSDTEVTVDASLVFTATASDPSTTTVSNRTITASLTASSAVFAATDVGRHVRLNYSGIWLWGKISVFTSSTVVTLNLYDEPPTNPVDNTKLIDNGRTNIWRFGSWSDTTGWPRSVTFHEQRLVFAGSRAEPQSVWFSRSGDFETFSPTEPDSSVLDDNGIGYALASNEVNAICWLQSATVLLIGTVGGEWQARAASSVQEAITPTNISITPQTSYGSIDYARPVRIGSSVLFIQRTGTKLIELSYSFELDAWTGRDLTIASEHILKGASGAAAAKELAWCAEPHNLLFVRLSDGTLACLTYNKEQEVLAWTKQNTRTGDTIDFIAALPAPDNSEHRLYAAITRTLAGVDAHMIERLSPNDTILLDSYEDVNLTAVSSITPAARFVGGNVVQVNQTRTSWIGQFTIGANIALGGTFNVDYYGLPYVAKLRTLPPEGGSAFGTAQGKMKRGARAALRVYASSSFFHGPSDNPTVEETFDSNPFTGDKAFTMNQDYSLEGGYYLTQSKSLPLNILAWMPQINTYE